MKTMLGPSITLMNRLKYSQKFIAAGILFVLPLVVTTIMLLASMNQTIHIAKAEQIGLQYDQPLQTFMQGVQLHRETANALIGGDKSAKSRLQQQEAQVQQAIQAVDKMDRRYGKALQTTDKWNAIKQQWASLQKNNAAMASETSYAVHTQLIADTLSLITHIAATSDLISDPQLDSHYLMDAIVNQLPDQTEDVSQAKELGMGIAASGQIMSDDKNQLMSLMDHTQIALNNIQNGLQIAIGANPDLKTKLAKDFNAYNDAVINFVQNTNSKLINSSFISVKPTDYAGLATTVLGAASKLYGDETAALNGLLQARSHHSAMQEDLSLTIGAVVLLLLIYFFLGFYYSVIRSVNLLKAAANRWASGDLTLRAELETGDELRQVASEFNAMADSFGSMVSANKRLAEQVAESANGLSTIADQSTQVIGGIVSMNQEIASGAENQAQRTEETSRAMEEMAAGIQKIAESSGVVAELSASMLEQAEGGNESILQAVRQMSTLRDSTNRVADLIRQLDGQARTIGRIASVITEIAVQTNLLSLNANIEAARAGEHGKGFMVVADEIRKLADNSKDSASQISAMIRQIQASASDAVAAMTQGVQESEKGILVMEGSGQAFDRILQAVRAAALQIDEVSAASEEIAAGTEEVTASVGELSTLANESASIAQQVASSSEEQTRAIGEMTDSVHALDGMAQELRQLAERFKV